MTGNTGIDALRTTVRDDYAHADLTWATGSRLILITAHRRENLGAPMHRMFRAIRRVMEEHPDTKAIYPIHMNPEVRRAAHAELDGFDRLRIVEPLEVLDFHNFMDASYLILTDSGGIQEEAPSLGKPVLVMRDTTERPEAWRRARSGSSAPMRSPSMPRSPSSWRTKGCTAPCRWRRTLTVMAMRANVSRTSSRARRSFRRASGKSLSSVA